jgi:hypothetical protein
MRRCCASRSSVCCYPFSFYHFPNKVPLTDKSPPANAKVLHNLYQHASPAAAKYAEADVIVASHRIGTFSAHLVRTRTDQAGLAVTLEVRGWKTHVEALEALFNLSRDRLSRAFEASEDMGGKLGNCELLDLK